MSFLVEISHDIPPDGSPGQPAMIVGMGIGVGFIVTSVFIPLLDMGNLTGK